MSKQANTKVIGGFVVGAIVLVVAGVLLFGSVKLFKEEKKFVLFFEGSVKGLSVGSPVDFRGVRVGSVTEIKIILNRKDLSLGIPVFIEIDPHEISFGGSEGEMMKMVESRLKGEKKFIELLIDNGLKAQLEMQSLVTGQLGVHLDFFPDEPAKLVGTEHEYTEIPTVESGLSEFMKTVSNLPLAEIANKVLKTLDGAEKLINSPEMKETVVGLNQTVKAARTLLGNVDSHVKPLANGADNTMAEAEKMFASAGHLARNLDSRIPPLIASLEDTSKAAGTTMRGANRAVDGLAGDNSPVRAELIKTLAEFASAARSFRVLAQYIESHPEAFVRGKNK